MRTKTYIQYLCPSTFALEKSCVPVEKRDSPKHAKEANKNVFAFYYYDVDEIDVIDKFGEKRIIESPGKNKSGTYFIDGEIFTIDYLIRINTHGRYDAFIRYLECNQWKKVILCWTGYLCPYKDGDCNIITCKQ
ncbi:MAG: hypothetical protein LBL79_07365 [Prevotella sp.]|jgi:hypothetical protein|nr:hypothetical protein [Prevotella sp.]